MATVAVCLLAAGSASAKTKPKTKTFSSGPINRTIPDPGPPPSTTFTIEEFIKIKKLGRIKDINVGVRITHPDNRFIHMNLGNVGGAPGFADLTTDGFRSLANPKGADFGAGAPDCTGALTVFDSDAPIPITAGQTPYAGSFAPMSTLDVFNGKQLAGKWRLEPSDINSGDAGVLNCWQLTVRYKPQKRKGDKK